MTVLVFVRTSIGRVAPTPTLHQRLAGINARSIRRARRGSSDEIGRVSPINHTGVGTRAEFGLVRA